jgi:FixJ family two-component response regulator
MTTTDQKPIVFVVDDDPDILAALSLLLTQENMEARTFENAEDFLACLSANDNSALLQENNCAILDVCLPGMDGLQLQKHLHEKGILLPIIFLTGHGDIPMSVEAIKAGAENFMTKPVSREKLMDSVYAAIQKNADWYSQNLQRAAARNRLNNLTSRELEILAMTLDGLPNKLIARHLEISLRTVEHHKAHILNKTGTANTFELTRLVQDSGLIFC